MSEDKRMPRFYYFANFTMRYVLFPLLRVEVTVTGVENVPRTGPLLIVSNHLSNTDPPLIGITIPRDVEMMSKAENFEGNPLMAWTVRNYGAFPIRRGEGDIGAIRYAMQVLKNRVLYIAPEGTRSLTGQLSEAHPGAARLALRTRAPVLPVGMTGQEHFLPQIKRLQRTSVHISIGRPFRLVSPTRKPDRPTLSAINDAMMGRIAAQLPPTYRGRFSPNGESPFVQELD
ncbi:MAG: lysophospholipid acyltransferase family protein [Ardenticatenaceae bacterium]